MSLHMSPTQESQPSRNLLMSLIKTFSRGTNIVEARARNEVGTIEKQLVSTAVCFCPK